MNIVQRSFCSQSYPPLDSNEVHVWLTNLERPTCETHLRRLLTPEEQSRADRYKMTRVRQQFVIGRGLLRKTLGHYLELAPQSVRIEYGPSGKPFVPNSDLEFNLSHVDGWALLGIARGRRIGIDLEPLRPVDNMEALVERFFAPAERIAFRTMANESRERGFFRGWTCKEAILKALGQSVQSLDRFDVELDPERPARLIRLDEELGNARDWTLITWEPCAGHLAAIAVEQGHSAPALEFRAEAGNTRAMIECCLLDSPGVR